MDLNLIQIDSYYDLDFQMRNKLILSISKPQNFFKTYFNNLKNSRTCVECFTKLNDLHFEIYGTYMYSSFDSFSKVYSRYIKKQTK